MAKLIKISEALKLVEIERSIEQSKRVKHITRYNKYLAQYWVTVRELEIRDGEYHYNLSYRLVF